MISMKVEKSLIIISFQILEEEDNQNLLIKLKLPNP